MWPQLILLLVSAIIQTALQPKPQKPAVGTAEAPVAEEGLPIRKVYGTVWIDNPQMLAWKRMGTDAIRTKGGKK